MKNFAPLLCLHCNSLLLLKGQRFSSLDDKELNLLERNLMNRNQKVSENRKQASKIRVHSADETTNRVERQHWSEMDLKGMS